MDDPQSNSLYQGHFIAPETVSRYPSRPTTELDWTRDRQRFAANARESERLGGLAARSFGYPLGPLACQFAELTRSLLDAETVEDVLDQIVKAAAAVTPQADVISVTLRTPDGAFHTPVATDSVARMIDEMQYEFGEGPCVTAAQASGPAVAECPDLGGEASPWPRLAPAVSKTGICAVLSLSLIPAPIPPRLAGAMNFYSRSACGLADVDRDLLLLLATHASLALATTEAVTTSNLREAQLHRAIDSRDVIGQAKGILMSRRGMSAEEAFDTLRRTSQELNMKLVQIAEILVREPALLD
ncbi:GAF and ANTAR domain-containing protein [Mycobacterium sp. B14F4]|uniref:GAF and ANTAR domain-containing protein n=1 Tax=Mycobacterium sp. B14F4 TaxID=3153565 RepID=UPI00325EC926